MHRTEINAITGETTVISLTLEEIAALPQPQPIVITPDWNALNESVLGGALAPLYQRLNAACLVNPTTASLEQIANAQNISTAVARIVSAVQTTRIEAALAAALSMLGYSDWEFSQEEKDLWNNTVASFGFSEIVYQ